MTSPNGVTPSEPANIWEELLDLLDQFIDIPSLLLREFFSVNRVGGLLRLAIFVFGGLVSWIILAVIQHPLGFNWGGLETAILRTVLFFTDPEPINALIIGPLKICIYAYFLVTEVLVRMFSADVFRHVLVVMVPVIMAIQISTLYLSDIFELEGLRIAFRFIMQAAFGIVYHRIKIQEGAVAQEDLDSTILWIGGPGRVQVNLENIAIFERINGVPHLIGPTVKKRGKKEFIQSFERMREVIDLREQFSNTTDILMAESRTRDGIRIAAQNIRYSFSVLRAAPGATPDLDNPLAYSEAAIHSLVYDRGQDLWPDEMWTLVRRELTNYIASLTLSEFLAQVDLPDQPSAQAQTIAFRSRPQLTQRFFEAEFRQMAANSGLQLNWIDVGTWVAPAALIPAKYLDAWKINVENQIRQQNIALLERETRLEEMLRLVREVPLISYRRSQAQGTLDEDIRIEIIADYLGTLRAAQAVMPIQVYPTERAQLDAAINYLGDYIRRHSSRAGLVRFLEPPAD